MKLCQVKLRLIKIGFMESLRGKFNRENLIINRDVSDLNLVKVLHYSYLIMHGFYKVVAICMNI